MTRAVRVLLAVIGLLALSVGCSTEGAQQGEVVSDMFRRPLLPRVEPAASAKLLFRIALIQNSGLSPPAWPFGLKRGLSHGPVGFFSLVLKV